MPWLVQEHFTGTGGWKQQMTMVFDLDSFCTIQCQLDCITSIPIILLTSDKFIRSLCPYVPMYSYLQIIFTFCEMFVYFHCCNIIGHSGVFQMNNIHLIYEIDCQIKWRIAIPRIPIPLCILVIFSSYSLKCVL